MGSPVTAVYVSCDTNQEIVHFTMDPATGALTGRGVIALPRGATWTASAPDFASLRTNVAPLATRPGGTFLYAAIRTEPFRLVGYRIAPDSGSVEPASEITLPASTPYIRTDRTGRYLFGAAYGGNMLWVCRIESDGRIIAPPIQIIENITTPHCILLDRDNRHVYVGATGHRHVLVFRFDEETGKLDYLGPPTAAATAEESPRHLALHPSGDFLYAINETSGTIDSFRTGTLERVQRLDPRPVEKRTGPGLGADLHLSPDSRFLYASARAEHTISVFAIGASPEQFSLVETVRAPNIPRSFHVDPTGRYLLAAGQGTSQITVYAIGRNDGRLKELSRYEVGPRPAWIEIVQLPG